MKRIIYLTVLIALIASCKQEVDKSAELQKLKIQRDELNEKILALEAEINPENQTDEQKAISVVVNEINNCVFDHFIKVQGTVDGDQNIAVSPQISGIVKEVYVKDGTPVKKGQVLAELDDQLTQQSLAEVNTQLSLATSIYEKQAALWEKKIGSEVQYLQAKNTMESLQQRANTIKEQIKLAKITSPITGTVESVPLRVGQMASPGNPASTIRVINMSVAKITADVAETYATRIKNGNPALVSFPDLNEDIETKLNFTSRFIDPSNRTFKVECRISSSDMELRANMMAYIKIKDYSNENAICLPVNTVQSDQNGKFVYLAKQNGNEWTAEKQTVKTGMDYNGTIEVLEGLTVGDKIIAAGFQNLNPGERIIF